jgi:hypothetical protein
MNRPNQAEPPKKYKYEPKLNACKDKPGKYPDEDEVTSRRMEHSTELLCREKYIQKPNKSNRHLTVQPWIQCLAMEEAEDVIVKLRKSQGPW